MLGAKVRHTLLTNVRVGQETKPVALAHRHLKSVHFLFLPFYIYIVIGMCLDWSQGIPLVISRPTHLHFTHDYTPPANLKTRLMTSACALALQLQRRYRVMRGRDRETAREWAESKCSVLYHTFLGPPRTFFLPRVRGGAMGFSSLGHAHKQTPQPLPARTTHTAQTHLVIRLRPQGRSKPYYALMGRIISPA